MKLLISRRDRRLATRAGRHPRHDPLIGIGVQPAPAPAVAPPPLLGVPRLARRIVRFLPLRGRNRGIPRPLRRPPQLGLQVGYPLDQIGKHCITFGYRQRLLLHLLPQSNDQRVLLRFRQAAQVGRPSHGKLDSYLPDNGQAFSDTGPKSPRRKCQGWVE